MRQAGARRIPPDDATPEEVLTAIGRAPVRIHVDWDSLEPGYVPAAYEVPGGLLPGQIKAIFAALPPGQIAGIELAEFEASDDEAENARAVAIVLDTIGPLLESKHPTAAALRA